VSELPNVEPLLNHVDQTRWLGSLLLVHRSFLTFKLGSLSLNWEFAVARLLKHGHGHAERQERVADCLVCSCI
jgi:hypothetical protein